MVWKWKTSFLWRHITRCQQTEMGMRVGDVCMGAVPCPPSLPGAGKPLLSFLRVWPFLRQLLGSLQVKCLGKTQQAPWYAAGDARVCFPFGSQALVFTGWWKPWAAAGIARPRRSVLWLVGPGSGRNHRASPFLAISDISPALPKQVWDGFPRMLIRESIRVLRKPKLRPPDNKQGNARRRAHTLRAV